MMIRSRKELEFYIMADRMMNRGRFRPTLKDRLKDLINHDYLMRYMRSLRYCSYVFRSVDARDTDPPLLDTPGMLMRIRGLFHRARFIRLGTKLGFTIGWHSLGYGAVVSHYGTIIVGRLNRIGNYAVINVSTCVSGPLTDRGKIIGDAFYMGTGAKVIDDVTFGDNVVVGANAVVTHNSDGASGCLLVGIPACEAKKTPAWYEQDEQYSERVRKIEALRKQMNID